MSTPTLTKEQEAAFCKAAVCDLLKWYELDYCNLQFERGLEYLDFYLRGDEFSIHMISRSRVFWNWWKNHWVQRDKEFLVYLQTPGIIKTLSGKRVFYSLNHNADELSRSIAPRGLVLQESYAEMMGQLLDQKNA